MWGGNPLIFSSLGDEESRFAPMQHIFVAEVDTLETTSTLIKSEKVVRWGGKGRAGFCNKLDRASQRIIRNCKTMFRRSRCSHMPVQCR